MVLIVIIALKTILLIQLLQRFDEFKNVIDGFEAVSRLATVDADNSFSEAEKLVKKNEVLTDLVDKYDYKIVEVNKALLESNNSDERDELMNFRRTLDSQRDDYEDLISENDKTLATLTPVVNDNSSNELKVLVNETNRQISSPKDFDGSLTNDGSFKSQEAADIIAETKDDRDEVIIKEQELASLQLDFESETKEKKQQKIQAEIDKKSSEVNSLKIKVGAEVIDADATEMESNDVAIVESIEIIKSLNVDYQSDENYLKLKSLMLKRRNKGHWPMRRL